MKDEFETNDTKFEVSNQLSKPPYEAHTKISMNVQGDSTAGQQANEYAKNNFSRSCILYKYVYV